MSFHMEESELASHEKKGAAVTETTPPAQSPEPSVVPAPAEKKEAVSPLAEDMKTLAAAVSLLLSRETGAVAEPAPKDEGISPLVLQLKQLAAAMTAVAKREAPVSPTPVVNVAAPHVTLNPELKSNHPRKWKMEVTERDNTHERRIKTIVIEAID